MAYTIPDIGIVGLLLALPDYSWKYVNTEFHVYIIDCQKPCIHDGHLIAINYNQIHTDTHLQLCTSIYKPVFAWQFEKGNTPKGCRKVVPENQPFWGETHRPTPDSGQGLPVKIYWSVFSSTGWWFGIWNHGILWLSLYCECHHPNWLSLHHFSEG